MNTSIIQAQEAANATPWLQILGAVCFGIIVGWYVYYINRYRQGGVQFSDLVTVIGIVGGGAILALFQPETDLFGAYGIGLAVGFFGYFLALLILVRISSHFDADWFLDGRRIWPVDGYAIPEGTRLTTTSMGDSGGGQGGDGADSP